MSVILAVYIPIYINHTSFKKSTNSRSRIHWQLIPEPCNTSLLLSIRRKESLYGCNFIWMYFNSYLSMWAEDFDNWHKDFLGLVSTWVPIFIFSWNTMCIFLLSSTELVTQISTVLYTVLVHDTADAGIVFTKLLATFFLWWTLHKHPTNEHKFFIRMWFSNTHCPLAVYNS